MNSILLGITTQETNISARNAVRYLSERIAARITNIEQCVIDAAATALRISPYEIEISIEPHKLLPLLNINTIELKQKIRAALCSQNPYFLIDSLNKYLSDLKTQKISDHFTGNIITGITTNKEADYIRSNGGLMMHIHNTHSKIQSPVNLQNGDLSIFASNSEPLQEVTLQAYANAIDEFFQLSKVTAEKEAA